MSREIIFEATSENFQQQVIEASHQQPVLVDFWATWCNPCKILLPILTQLAQAYQGKFLLAKVDTEQQRSLAEQFAIRSIPHVMLFKDGEMVDSFSGALPESEIRLFIDNYLPGVADDLLSQARSAYQSAENSKATALVEQAIKEMPESVRIIAQACGLLIDNGDFQLAAQHLEHLPINLQTDAKIAPLLARLSFVEQIEGLSKEQLEQLKSKQPESQEERFQLAAYQVLKGEIEQAMESLLEIIKQDPKFREGAARKRMLKIFEILGNSGELVHKYRMQMAKYLM